jgi:methyl-accepting chemotaxis protein
MLLVSLVPLGILGYTLRNQLNQSLTQSADQELSLQTEKAAEAVDGYIAGFASILKAAANLPALTSMDPAQQTPVLVALAKSGLATIHITNTAGHDVSRSDGGQLLDMADRTWFQAAVKGNDGKAAYQTVISKATNKPVLNIAFPIQQNGAVVGVIDGTIELNQISAQISSIKIGSTGYAWLVDDTNHMMAGPDKSAVEKMTDMSADPAVKAARSGSTAVTSVPEGGKAWLQTQRVLPQGWVLAVQMEEAEAMRAATTAQQSLVRTLLIVLVGVLLLAALLGRSLSKPIQTMAAFVRKVGQGDFTTTLGLRRSDELGDMATALNQLSEGLRKHIGSVHTAVTSVLGTGAELSTAAGQAAESQEKIADAFQRTLTDVQAATTSQQEHLDRTRDVVGELVAAVEQIATSATHQAEEVTEASEVVAAVAKQADVVSEGISLLGAAVERAASAAGAGRATVEGALSGIRSTKENVDGAAATVRELGQRSEAIGQILQEITAIADQTNLLALNAAIEAARAGEAGRGFAVVADEVRKLADRSVHSAQEINAILASVKTGVEKAVTVMAAGTAAAGEGATRANEAQASLNEIVEAVALSAEQARTIQTAVLVLVQGHERLAKSTQNLAAVTEENSAAAEEMAAGSETVKAAVQALDTLALQNFAAIQGVGTDLNAITESVQRIARAVGQLETVSHELKDSVESVKA